MKKLSVSLLPTTDDGRFELLKLLEGVRVFFSLRVICKPEFSIDFMSSSMETVLGYKPQQFLENPQLFFQIIHPDDLPLVQQHIHQPEVHVERLKLRFKHQNGEYIPLQMMNATQFSQDGILQSVLCFCWVEDEGDYSEKILPVIYDYWSKTISTYPLPVSVTTYDDGRFILSNPAFAEMTGYETDEIIGHNVIELNIWAKPKDRLAFLTDLATTESVSIAPRSILSKDGVQLDIRVTSLLAVLNNELCILNVYHNNSNGQSSDTQAPLFAENIIEIIRNDPNIIAVLDKDLRYLIVSKGYLNFHHITDMNMVGLRQADVLPEIYQKWYPYYQKCLLGAVENGTIESYRRSDGCEDHVRWECRPLYDAQNKIGGIIQYLENTTPQVKALAELQKNEELFRSFIEQSFSGFVLLDESGCIIEWNHALKKLTGLSRAAVINKPGLEILLQLISPHDLLPNKVKYFTSRWERAIKKGKANFFNRTIYYKIHNTDGEIRFVEGVFFPIKTSDGYRLGGIVQDITSQRLAEESQRESEQIFHFFVDQDTDGICLVDYDSRIFDWNKSLEKITGLSRSDMLGKFFVEAMEKLMIPERSYNEEFSKKHSQERLKILRNMEVAGIAKHKDVEIQCPDGTRKVISVQLHRIHTRKRMFIGGTIRDITDQVRMEQNNKELLCLAEAMRDTSITLTSTLHINEVLERILLNVGKVVPHETANIMLIKGNLAHIVRCHGYERYLNLEQLFRTKYDITMLPNLKQMVETRQPLWIPDVTKTEDWVQTNQSQWIKSYTSAPICIRNQVVGFINLDSAIPGYFNQQSADRLQAFASQAAIAIENARLYEEIRSLATTDELTGVYNRRGLFEFGRREVERAIRFERPLAVIMFDIDWFKRINDTLGHQTGDEVLAGVAKRCRDILREVDIIGRFGGEEFVILLPENNMETAKVVAERLRLAMYNNHIQTQKQACQVSISLGIAEIKPGINNLGTLISYADEALYTAKETGRNQVSVSPR